MLYIFMFSYGIRFMANDNKKNILRLDIHIHFSAFFQRIFCCTRLWEIEAYQQQKLCFNLFFFGSMFLMFTSRNLIMKIFSSFFWGPPKKKLSGNLELIEKCVYPF